MKRSYSRFFQLGLSFLLLIIFQNRSWSADTTVQIRSPKDGSHITQEQNYVLVGGKVGSEASRSGYVDIFLVLDVSNSTAQYAGVELPEFSEFPNSYWYRRGARPPLPCAGMARAGGFNLRNSILAVEIVAARHLLSQLDPETTRVGVITFGEQAWLKQRLTHDFDQIRSALDSIYKRGPDGGTNMVDGIRIATDELLGKGESEKYLDSIKALFFFTDGFPTLPSRDCKSADTDLAIDAARRAAKAGISVHVFALGEEALSNPRAAVGIARESGGTYTAVSRPADVLVVVDKVSAVGVDSIQVTNETIQQNALQSRLAVDGFFASAVPVVEGLNRIQVLSRASNGSIARHAITVHYQPGKERSLALEVFLENEKRSLDLEVSLEKEKRLKLEIERLGKKPDQIHTEVDRNRKKHSNLTPAPPAPTAEVQ